VDGLPCRPVQHRFHLDVTSRLDLVGTASYTPTGTITPEVVMRWSLTPSTKQITQWVRSRFGEIN